MAIATSMAEESLELARAARLAIKLVGKRQRQYGGRLCRRFLPRSGIIGAAFFNLSAPAYRLIFPIHAQARQLGRCFASIKRRIAFAIPRRHDGNLSCASNAAIFQAFASFSKSRIYIILLLYALATESYTNFLLTFKHRHDASA